MSLTLPNGGTNPGRAAQAQPVEAGNLGAALAEFGGQVTDVALQLRAEQDDRQLKRAQVDLTRDVNDLRLEVEQIGDPDAADAAWQQGVANLRGRYTQAGADGTAAPINRRNANDFGLMFDSLTNSVGYDIGRRNLGLRNSQRDANWLSYMQAGVDAAARSNPETRAVIIDAGMDQIDGDLAAGAITPEEAERRRITLMGDVDNARAIRMIGEDPDAFLAGVQAGEFDGLNGEAIARYEVQAQAAIERRENAATAEAAKAEKARQAEIAGRLNDLRDMYLDGREITDEAYMARPEVQAHPAFAEAAAARALRDEGKILPQMTVAEIDAEIATEERREITEPWEHKRLELLRRERRAAAERDRAREAEVATVLGDIRQVAAAGRVSEEEDFLTSPDAAAHPDYARTRAAVSLREEGHMLNAMAPAEVAALVEAERGREITEPWEAERLTMLEGWLDDNALAYQADPIGQRQKLAGDVEPLPEFDPANPEAFAEAIEDRRMLGRTLQAEGYSPELRLFSDEERARLKTLTGPDADPDTRLAMARLMSGTDAATRVRVSEIGGDPVFGHVSGLLGAGGAEATAREILKGQRIIAEKTVIMPPRADRATAAFDHLSGFFAGMPAGGDVEASVIAATDALYASRIRTTGPADDIDEGVYTQALHEVLGGTGRVGRSDARGGVQIYNGALTPLPRNVSVDGVEDAMQEIRRNLSGVRSPVYNRAIDGSVLDTAAATGVVVRPITRRTPEEARERGRQQLLAASRSGGVPVVGGALIDPRDLDHAQFRAIGDDLYQMTIDGRPIQDDTTGGPYLFSITRLMREAGR
jgi:hypothetical protein